VPESRSSRLRRDTPHLDRRELDAEFARWIWTPGGADHKDAARREDSAVNFQQSLDATSLIRPIADFDKPLRLAIDARDQVTT